MTASYLEKYSIRATTEGRFLFGGAGLKETPNDPVVLVIRIDEVGEPIELTSVYRNSGGLVEVPRGRLEPEQVWAYVPGDNAESLDGPNVIGRQEVGIKAHLSNGGTRQFSALHGGSDT